MPTVISCCCFAYSVCIESGVRAGAEEALTHLATSLARAAAERDALAEARTGREAELLVVRARPSPFYVLDEVEAALDDVNLGRLLTLIEQLRDTSQLIVITHQKRTMEIADALYGVSMRGDGITGVISQRLRELQAS